MSQARSPGADPAAPMITLEDNPFCILGASTMDSSDRIIELAEERSLVVDPERCVAERNLLINPRPRLAAEIAWLPAFSVDEAENFLMWVYSEPNLEEKCSAQRTLAYANLVAGMLESRINTLSDADMQRLIAALARRVEHIDLDAVADAINNDRAAAGFTIIRAQDSVETAFFEHKRYYTGVIRSLLDSLPSDRMVATMARLVTQCTHKGTEHADALIDEAVEQYENEANRYLVPESENLVTLAKAALEKAPEGAGHVIILLDQMDRIVRKWMKVAAPIQMSLRARGLRHELTRNVCRTMRDLGVDLYNKYDMLALSKRIVDLLQELLPTTLS